MEVGFLYDQVILFRPVVLLAFLSALAGAAPQARILDLKHYSSVFGEERNLRVFLPPGYDADAAKRYPVVYFFHGWGQRFNGPGREGRNYDIGSDYGGDTIAAFVATHNLIVVKWDGYNPRTPGEDYPRPYNVYPVETNRQFPLYFPELVRYIDANFRTIADREHRATSGLSMGGFMSFWVAGKYPDMVSSASNFMGSSEFVAGPKDFPAEYRHDEMYGNYDGVRTRLVMGTDDFIRWYHRRMNAVWDFARPNYEHEEFVSDHGTPGMAKTLAFHMAAFADPLPRPALWQHADLYPSFDVWGWSVESDRRQPGFAVLENVSASGFHSSVREWLPDGALLRSVTLRISTAPICRAGAGYAITDVNLDTGEVRRAQQTADAGGRLHFVLDGGRHEIGFTDAPKPLLTVAAVRVLGAPWAVAGQPVRLELEILNKGSAAAQSIPVLAASENFGVRVLQPPAPVRSLAPGAIAAREIVILAQDPRREAVRLEIRAGDAATPAVVRLFPDAPPLADVQVLDGEQAPIWQRAVNKAEVRLGEGNANAVAERGETIAIGIPDHGALRAAELFGSDSCIDLSRRLSDPWADYDHVGATAKISLAHISSSCPEGREVPLFVRYLLPNKPEHVLKEGVLRLRIGGKLRSHARPLP